MLNEDMQERLEMMIACGYPIFMIGDNVVLPAEVDFIFTPEEQKLLEAHIRTSMNRRTVNV